MCHHDRRVIYSETELLNLRLEYDVLVKKIDAAYWSFNKALDNPELMNYDNGIYSASSSRINNCVYTGEAKLWNDRVILLQDILQANLDREKAGKDFLWEDLAPRRSKVEIQL